MNIKDFSETNRVEQKQTQSKNSNVKDKFEQIKDTPEFKQVENEYGDFIKDFVDNYSNMSESELMQEMLRLVAQKKAEGDFNPQQIRELAEVVAPLLDPEQRAKMYNLLNYLD
ncbi:MAG: hypothetical protein J6C13_02820 [Clostridia bacterium]|nr:hypothetical protein [Clostridia bacterium]